MKPLLFVFGALLIAAAFSPAQAMPPTARRAIGTIERVDTAKRQIVVRPASHAQSLRLTFDQRTRMWSGSQTTTTDALKRGQAVQVSYRLPLIGPDYASRIVLLSPSKTNNPNTQDKQ